MPAGIDPTAPAAIRGLDRLPRARGDRPGLRQDTIRTKMASPCPRGSTRESRADLSVGAGFPVPAGIDPCRRPQRDLGGRLPRARGDRPGRPTIPASRAQASPCPRGSTLGRHGTLVENRGFPVPAGIDPVTKTCQECGQRLPRARGDRPDRGLYSPLPTSASPCPRGSTRALSPEAVRGKGFPVPAGIDPD